MNGVGRGENKQNKNVGALLTRETVGMTLLLFSAVMLFISATGGTIFGDIGVAITAFFVGLVGFFAYPVFVLLFYVSIVLVFGKKPIPTRWIVKVYFLLTSIFLIVHLATSDVFFARGFGGYINACWTAASESVASGTGGGVLLGLIAYPVCALLSAAGSYILYSLLIVLALYLIALDTPLRAIILPSARMRTEKPKKKASVAFDDLPTSTRTPALDGTARSSETIAGRRVYAENGAPVYSDVNSAAQSAAQSNRAAYTYGASQAGASKVAPPLSSQDAYARSRAILFQNDPASDYRNNLIFDRDSHFNTAPRHSSVGPSGRAQDADKFVPNDTKNDDTPSVSYTQRYTAQTEESRPAMPKRITQERFSPSTPSDDFNYPQTPSYRAPTVPVYPKQDDSRQEGYDARATENVSVDPAPFEQPARTERDVSSRFQSTSDTPSFMRAETAKDTDASPFMPLRRGNAPSEGTPFDTPAQVEPEKTSSSFASEPVYGTQFPARESYLDPVKSGEADMQSETPSSAVTSEGPSADSKAREREFRSLFSRPVEERTRIDESAIDDERFDRTKLSRSERFVMPESPFDGASDKDESLSGPVFDARARSSAADLFDEEEEDVEPVLPVRGRDASARGDGLRRSARNFEPESDFEESAPAPQPQKHVYKKYVRPSIENLDAYDDSVHISQEEIERNSAIILETLAGFRVDAEVVKVTIGSAVTRYDIDIPPNIAVRTVIKRDAEIAMRLHARDGVNIYSNSEVGAISIEVPNSVRATVGLRSVMTAPEFVNAKPNALAFAIGKDVEGRNVCGNIVKMKHLLVAGATGSGKSVCLNAMIISLICKYSPEEMRLILIDPKKVEFTVFDGLPHLMINEIIADAQKAVSALNWAIKEMERRYTLFEQKTRSGSNVHNVDEYNAALGEDEEKLPKIVIVVDELADLMSVAKKDIEDRIQRLAQKARAAGMHLVIATQRPSVDVITGVIKGNLPTRIACRVVQEVDSRTILDESGAEKLLGLGDMLFRTEGMYNCLRVQGAYIDSKEVQRIVDDIKSHNEAYFDKSIADYINKTESDLDSEEADDGGSVDPQYVKALAIAVKLGTASISLIQRKCSVGYNHAGKIMEWMELMGYVSPFDGKAKARTVLLTKEDFEAKYGDLDG